MSTPAEIKKCESLLGIISGLWGNLYPCGPGWKVPPETPTARLLEEIWHKVRLHKNTGEKWANQDFHDDASGELETAIVLARAYLAIRDGWLAAEKVSDTISQYLHRGPT